MNNKKNIAIISLIVIMFVTIIAIGIITASSTQREQSDQNETKKDVKLYPVDSYMIGQEQDEELQISQLESYIGSTDSLNNYLGMIFPANKITKEFQKAELKLYSPHSQWIKISTAIYLGKPEIKYFNDTNLPSRQEPVGTKINYTNDENWEQAGYYSIDITQIVEEYVNSGLNFSTINLIIQNTSEVEWARKAITTDFSNSDTLPYLEITY